jgi:hypothetical protein
MPQLKSRGLFMLAVRVLCAYADKLLLAHRLKAVEALSTLVQTEHFVTYFDSYVDLTNDNGDVDALLRLKDSVLAELMKDVSQRKLVRPLQDAVDKSKRLCKGVCGADSGRK